MAWIRSNEQMPSRIMNKAVKFFIAKFHTNMYLLNCFSKLSLLMGCLLFIMNMDLMS